MFKRDAAPQGVVEESVKRATEETSLAERKAQPGRSQAEVSDLVLVKDWTSGLRRARQQELELEWEECLLGKPDWPWEDLLRPPFNEEVASDAEQQWAERLPDEPGRAQAEQLGRAQEEELCRS